ncbi:MAG: hypothetical protein A2W18_04755 [Candidatus Muproteobacteria bacterium RBG_16_60_9]|uniref:Uncharacterized protein n=1 Tax=Candidatus Muproteobacteria bacterium RBG_16_60_9 TaxID=1817755 RepID=A0A1F6VD00_9PROT|nr:MAG: hypothetical protein A2W18_04755 [Candidatus Muproteobacteria bacterium RBG_16_60_9]
MRDLVSLPIDGLREVALAVKQADRYERNAEVARGFAVVAGEYAQAAGVNLKAFVETEFGAEVGDQIFLRVDQTLIRRLSRCVMVVVVDRKQSVVFLHENPILGRFFQPILRNAAQEHLRIVARALPQLRIEAIEQISHRAIPAVE